VFFEGDIYCDAGGNFKSNKFFDKKVPCGHYFSIKFTLHALDLKVSHFANVSVVTKFAGLLVKFRDGHQVVDWAK
jgi:hypothetical protein